MFECEGSKDLRLRVPMCANVCQCSMASLKPNNLSRSVKQLRTEASHFRRRELKAWDRTGHQGLPKESHGFTEDWRSGMKIRNMLHQLCSLHSLPRLAELTLEAQWPPRVPRVPQAPPSGDSTAWTASVSHVSQSHSPWQMMANAFGPR